MAPATFQPHKHPQLVALMHRILERMQSDLLEALGLAIVVHDKRNDAPPSVLAAAGAGGIAANYDLKASDFPFHRLRTPEIVAESAATPRITADLFDATGTTVIGTAVVADGANFRLQINSTTNPIVVSGDTGDLVSTLGLATDTYLVGSANINGAANGASAVVTAPRAGPSPTTSICHGASPSRASASASTR